MNESSRLFWDFLFAGTWTKKTANRLKNESPRSCIQLIRRYDFLTTVYIVRLRYIDNSTPLSWANAHRPGGWFWPPPSPVDFCLPTDFDEILIWWRHKCKLSESPKKLTLRPLWRHLWRHQFLKFQKFQKLKNSPKLQLWTNLHNSGCK